MKVELIDKKENPIETKDLKEVKLGDKIDNMTVIDIEVIKPMELKVMLE